MKDFDSLADENWRILIHEHELNEPTICYPDPDRRNCYVGPLLTAHVGCTVEDEDGEEALELDGADGRNLAAAACLPQFAELFRWIRASVKKLGVSESDEYNEFIDSLTDRIDWITECIDDRQETMNVGEHGFERFRKEHHNGVEPN